MEPTIYKPSIYKGAGIYKTGDEGGGFEGVEINGVIWSKKNLDIVFDDLQINTLLDDQNPKPIAYTNGNNPESFVSDYGYLYNWYAIKYINEHKDELIKGWHIATEIEWDNLISFIGGTPNMYSQLRSMLFAGGYDDFGFRALAAGYATENAQKYNLNQEANFSSSTSNDSSTRVCYYFNSSNSGKYNHVYGLGVSVRLVKD